VRPGAMLISFDLELVWGTRRNAHDGAHATGIERVRDVVHSLLDVFVKYEMSTTWAAVGHLMLTPEHCVDGRYDYDLPAPEPAWFRGNWYSGIPCQGDGASDRYYAPDLIEAIIACPVYQELASHTFSHVVFGDPSCSRDVAAAELQRCKELGRYWGREINSLVFPRNSIGHLDVAAESGYKCYRGVNSEWYWFGRAGRPPDTSRMAKVTGLGQRVLRFADERLRICPPLPPARRVGGLWELPHSMYFPGSSGLSRFVSPEHQWCRAVKGLRKAADTGRIFSLFTHPHNFLPNPAPHLRAIESICQEAARLRDSHRLGIRTMGEIADDLDREENLHWTAE